MAWGLKLLLRRNQFDDVNVNKWVAIVILFSTKVRILGFGHKARQYRMKDSIKRGEKDKIMWSGRGITDDN